ncbi:MAG: hypothetical protein AAGA48_15965 [Myxococcota bacterium]
MMQARWVMAAAWGLLAGCPEAEPPECEVQGTSTCSSTLVVEDANDDRSAFILVVRNEDEGLDLQIRCPTLATEEPRQDNITWFCGAAQVTLERNDRWPDTLEVSFETMIPMVVTPDYTSGLDSCGNQCNDGTISL